jgi:type II secretory pathway predicted ATPase ExeA
MYCDFFQLERLPFNNTPDPRFFFNTPDHEEALASLLYAAEQRKGFVLVSGEVGSGKTLLSRLLLGKLGPCVKTAVINNTRLSGPELLMAICREFDVETEEGATMAEISHALEQFLLEQYARDRLAVVVLDEAQNLPLEAFEELRMLGNLEADDAKLLQVLILGQPELQDSFRQPSMRQLHQRVFRTFHLKALTRELTGGYINHRLQVAGLPAGQQVFETQAMEAIYRHSEGIPRLINQICDNAMLAAYTESSRQVSAKIIHEVVEQMMALTVVSSETKPKGALARKMLGTADRSEPARREQPSRETVPDAREMERQVEEQLEPLTGRVQEFDRLVTRLADRLGASERALAHMQKERELHSDPNPEVVAELQAARELRQQLNDALRRTESRNTALQTQVSQLLEALRLQTDSQQQRSSELAVQHRAELEEARRTRQQAEQMLNDAKAARREADERIRQMLEEAKSAAGRVQEQSAQALGESEKQNAVLQAQAKYLLTEVHSYTKGQQNCLSELLSQERAEFEAAHQMRRQASELLGEVTKASQEANARIQEMLDEARQTSETVENQAAASLSETEKQNALLRERVNQLLEQIRTRGEEQNKEAEGLVSQHRVEIEATKKHMLALDQAMRQSEEQARHRGEEMMQHFQSQVKAMSDHLESLQQNSETRASEVNASVVNFVTQTRSRMEQMHAQLIEAISAAGKEVQEARDSFDATKERMIADAESGREQASELIEQTRDLLLKTREQSASLLADLRTQMTEQTDKAERFWQMAAAEGAKTLSELNSRLSETRLLTDRSRSELESLVQDAMSEIANARSAFEVGLSAHRSEIARLTTDATAIKTDIAQRFEDARKDLDVVVGRHEQVLRQRAIKLIGETDESMTAAETRAKETVASLQVQLQNASDTAAGIYDELQKSLGVLQQNATECRQQYESEAARLAKELPELIDRNRRLLDEAQAQVDVMSERATSTVEELRNHVEDLKESARNGVADIGLELDHCLEETVERAEKLRAESESAVANLAERMDQTKRKAETATTHAEKAVATIREQSKSSLSEVRAGLTQMTKRADLLQHDFAQMRDEITEGAKASCQQLRDSAASVAEHIESLREAAQRDAEANFRRLAALREQVEQGTEQVRQNANRLLDQVQAGTTSLREHANELLTGAQNGADKIGEQAASLLMQAHASAERFREQAETLLRRSEAITEAVRNDVATIRSEILRETQEVREQIGNAKQDLVEARGESSELLTRAKDLQTETQQKAGEILRQAGEIKESSEALLRTPRQLVEEANQRAAALAEMSKKVSTVVQQLATAGDEAQQKKSMLEQANSSAGETVEVLKRHTARVGQLVGIIRQLYGTMDARVEGMRNRLAQADELCRAVPQQIDSLRAVLETGGAPATPAVEARAPAATKRSATKPPPAAQPAVPAKAAPAVASTKSAPAAGVAALGSGDRRTLGEIAKRNKKLNEWLRDVLNENSSEVEATATPAADRIKQEAASKA